MNTVEAVARPQAAPYTHALERYIRASAEELLAAAGNAEREGMLFVGVAYDAYPTLLVRDRSLTDSAKVQLLYLLQEARNRPHGVTGMPPVQQTREVLGHSKGTVVRDRLLLRITRWATLCERVRDPRGRLCGSVYAFHGEPASLTESSYLDVGYMRLLEQAASGHYDPYVQRAAQGVLRAIDQDISGGRDPLERPDPVSPSGWKRSRPSRAPRAAGSSPSPWSREA